MHATPAVLAHYAKLFLRIDVALTTTAVIKTTTTFFATMAIAITPAPRMVAIGASAIFPSFPDTPMTTIARPGVGARSCVRSLTTLVAALAPG